MAEQWVVAATAVLREEAARGNTDGLPNQVLFEKIRQRRLVALVYVQAASQCPNSLTHP